MARAKKTYGKRSAGIQISDASVAKLAAVGEIRCAIEEEPGRRKDPMVRALASALPDDEPSTADEDVAAAEALAAYRHGEGIGPDQLRAELDLGADGDPRHGKDDV
jgi:hypothetical protein